MGIWTQVNEPPEFFLDRGLGKRVAEGLRQAGWVLHLITEHYPDDAQHIPDEEWVAEARRRGWSGLTKDQRLWRLLKEEDQIPIFTLSTGQISSLEMVARFEAARELIWNYARKDDVGLWIVYEVGRPPHRRYPR
ncbi:PIN-like domain-containing protein [Tessaracoccus caeni]|uniref:PIN-like domain-containing protein n=1 Tax=Tessaracoccus caeni TaxID=3031239 RepID=UPI0023DA02E7|nr:hypothetical protein [Tessaracoccus caeni]MDF1488326.1 hypothetical protein [Tessaracoccus caeni]